MVHLYSAFIQGILQRLCTTFTYWHIHIHTLHRWWRKLWVQSLAQALFDTNSGRVRYQTLVFKDTLPLSPWYWPSTAAGPRPSSVAGYQPPASDYQLLVTGPWPPATFHQSRSRPQVPQSGRGLPLSCQFRCGYLTSYQLTKNYNLLANGHRPCQTAFGALN